MSSHHFVKEGQEPALVIMEALELNRVEPLLEWVPLVIVSDAVLEDVRMWGIKIDVVVSTIVPADQISEILSDQFPLQILPVESSENSITAILKFLSARKQAAVNFLMSPTAEHFILLEKFQEMNINIISDTEKWSLCHAHFNKWMAAKSTLFIREIGSNNALNLEGLTLKDGQAISHQDGVISIHSSTPFWVGEPL